MNYEKITKCVSKSCVAEGTEKNKNLLWLEHCDYISNVEKKMKIPTGILWQMKNYERQPN